MCVIVLKLEGQTVSEEILSECYKRNKDSIGYMFNHNGALKIRKFLTWEDFIVKYREDLILAPKGNFCIHFRIATSGKVNLENCHPFQVTPFIGLVHNGILSKWKGNVKQSDTNQFAQDMNTILSIPKNWDKALIWKMAEEMIGSYNKMVFLRNDGDVTILNEKGGTWENGLWFSNMIWKPYVSQVSNYTGRWNDKEEKKNQKKRKYDPKKWDGEDVSQGDFCSLCNSYTPGSKLESWGGVKVCKECFNEETTSDKNTTIPIHCIDLNLMDVEYLKPWIDKVGEHYILKYSGLSYVVRTRETAIPVDRREVDIWLQTNKRRYISETSVKTEEPKTNVIPFQRKEVNGD